MSLPDYDPHESFQIYSMRLRDEAQNAHRQLLQAYVREGQTQHSEQSPYRWGEETNHPAWQRYQTLLEEQLRWSGQDAEIPQCVRQLADPDGPSKGVIIASHMATWIRELRAVGPVRRLMEEYPNREVRECVARQMTDPPVEMVEELLDDLEMALLWAENQTLSHEAARTVGEWLSEGLRAVHRGDREVATRRHVKQNRVVDQYVHGLKQLIDRHDELLSGTLETLIDIVEQRHEEEYNRSEEARKLLEDQADEMTREQLLEAFRRDPRNTWAGKALLEREDELTREDYARIAQGTSTYSLRRALASSSQALQHREVRQELLDTTGESVLEQLLQHSPPEEVAEIIETSLQEMPRKTAELLQEGKVNLSQVRRKQLLEGLQHLPSDIRFQLIRALGEVEQGGDEPQPPSTGGRTR